MLQNKLSSGKTSDNMKQKMFERDLELEMLRRKKNYQNSGNKWNKILNIAGLAHHWDTCTYFDVYK